MAHPIRFSVTLGWRFWVRVYVWPLASDAPDNAEGRDAAFFLQDDDYPRKLGDVHFGLNFFDVETITHEAYHVIAELRRRIDGADTDHGEEWCARQAERLVPVHQEPQKRFDEAFVENPEAAIQQQITRTVVTSRIAEVLEEEADKNREEFNERYAYAQQWHNSIPNWQ